MQICTFCTFYLAAPLVDFLKSAILIALFSKGSRSLCSTPFCTFDQKVHFWPIFRSKCREMSGHCHGFIYYFLTKKYFIWPLHAVFKSALFSFFKRGGAKVVQAFCLKKHKSQKVEKSPRATCSLLLGKSCIVKYSCAFGKT